MLQRILFFTLAGLFMCQWAAVPAAEPIPAADFDKLLKLIKPTAEESSWASISWMLELGPARAKAAAEGKPLVVWTMSGEPLGTC